MGKKKGGQRVKREEEKEAGGEKAGVQEPVEDKSGEEASEMAEREALLTFRTNEGKHRGSEWKHRKMFKEGRNKTADVGRRRSSTLIVLSHLRPLHSLSQRLKAFRFRSCWPTDGTCCVTQSKQVRIEKNPPIKLYTRVRMK